MEKQTMKVIYNDDLSTVYEKPVNNGHEWFFEDVRTGTYIPAKACTPVPEETDIERARRRWEEWKREPGCTMSYETATNIIEPLLAEISRLTAGAWTEEEARGYALHCVMKWTSEEIDSPSDWIAARRKERGGKV